jgi:hypothetical protein
MAEQNLSAPARAYSQVRRSVGGVSHVKEYQPNRYTIVGNHLAQHRELSLLAIGLAAHIQSVPEGTPVDIRSLAARFPEGRDSIAAAYRELEAHGYVERRRERTPEGRIVTRTVSYSVPPAVRAAQPTPPPARPAAAPAPVPVAVPEPVKTRRASSPLPQEHRTAAVLLAGLRRDDDRLTLSERDVRRLAPAVTAWLERGATPEAVRRTLTANLPVPLHNSPGLLAHRLTELLPPPLPTVETQPRPAPLINCDGCERAFRSPEPGALCRECEEDNAPVTAGAQAAA